ncbi:MAG TPA: DUF488 domain-containing protein [Acidimicrobiales bacterium]|nr:DUF488 domain-containing protein [Acidimicrobiales bacterium]
MALPSPTDVPRTLLTVGHGTLEADELAELLREAGVEVLVDVRTAPGSRRLPHFNQADMKRWLPAAGIAYDWERDLGGFRKTTPSSRNVALRNANFRGYGDYMETPPFWRALSRVLAEAARRQTVVMCSESLWWRCHRRLVADAAVLVKQFPVNHLMHNGTQTGHRVTEGARLTDDGLVRYDAGHAPLLSADDTEAIDHSSRSGR